MMEKDDEGGLVHMYAPVRDTDRSCFPDESFSQR